MTFPGYPLSTDFDDNTPNLTTQAEAHNEERGALNDLQDQISALAAAVDATVSTLTELVAFKALFDGPVAYTPQTTGLTSVGASPGERWGRYVRLGDLVFVEFGFRLGSGFVMSSTTPVSIELPFPANPAFITGARRPVFVGYANNASESRRTSGAGIILSTNTLYASRFANEQTGLGWDGNSPFTWAVDDDFEGTGFYWATPGT